MDWSGLGQSVKSDAKGITGNIAKAVLVFPDSVPSDINLKDGDAVGAFGAALGAKRTGTYIHSFNMQNNGIKNISKGQPWTAEKSVERNSRYPSIPPLSRLLQEVEDGRQSVTTEPWEPTRQDGLSTVPSTLILP